MDKQPKSAKHNNSNKAISCNRENLKKEIEKLKLKAVELAQEYELYKSSKSLNLPYE